MNQIRNNAFIVKLSTKKCCDVFFAEAQSSPTGDTGDSVDTVVFDAVFKRPSSGQCQECPVSSVHCVVLCVLVLVDDIRRVATVSDTSLG